MTPRQADKLIAGKTPVTLHNTHFNETFGPVIIIGRDRWNVFTTDGGTYDRGELEVVAPAATEGGR